MSRLGIDLLAQLGAPLLLREFDEAQSCVPRHVPRYEAEGRQRNVLVAGGGSPVAHAPDEARAQPATAVCWMNIDLVEVWAIAAEHFDVSKANG